ncbi:MAG: hypothetical protein RL557_385 [archaeon]|jgi:hypothetical protein
MKAKTRQIIIVLLCLFVIQTVLAETTINVKSLPDHRISIIIREAGKLTSLESFHKDTGTGELVIPVTTSVDSIDIIVTLKKDSQNIINRKYEGLETGKIYYLDFIPGEDKLQTQEEIDAEKAKEIAPVETNPTVENEETQKTTADEQTDTEEPATEKEVPTETHTETQKAKTDDKLTSFALLDKLPVDTSWIMKIGIGLLVIIGAIVMIKVVPAFKKEETFTVRPLSELKREMGKTHADKRIEEIEKKIHDAQRELEALRNHDSRLKEVQDRVKKDQEELRRLQHGY